MLNIKKRSEKQEEFSIKKIEKSMRSAGTDENTAKKIAGAIQHKEGLRTSDVRKQVVAKLAEHDGKFVKAYEGYEKPAPAKK